MSNEDKEKLIDQIKENIDRSNKNMQKIDAAMGYVPDDEASYINGEINAYSQCIALIFRLP